MPSPANVLRIFFLILMGVGGWFCSQANPQWEFQPWLGSFAALAIGLMVILADRLLKGFSLRAFSSATFGLVLGCVMAWLIRESQMFIFAEYRTQWLIMLVTYMSFGYLGMMLALRSNKDEFSLIIPYVRFARQDTPEHQLLVDTSALIDGRVQQIASAGFIDGTIYLPRFVLKELQAIADSQDPVRRERGRRGLDIVKEMQKLPGLQIQILENDYPDEPDVDGKLVRAAKVLNAKIVTTDYNLNKVAQIQKVKVLNVNELSNAMKPVAIAGDVMRLHLVKEGRDPGQAVGYLPDGTMIVVNNARHLIGHNVEVQVINSLQTAAGRLVFADVRGAPNSHSHGS